MTGTLPCDKCVVHSQKWDDNTVLLCVTPTPSCPKKRNRGIFNYECIPTVDHHYDEVTEWIKINARLYPEKEFNPCDKCVCEDCGIFEEEITDLKKQIEELAEVIWKVDSDIDSAYKNIEHLDPQHALGDLEDASKRIAKVK